jgi:hypothetical protein
MNRRYRRESLDNTCGVRNSGAVWLRHRDGIAWDVTTVEPGYLRVREREAEALVVAPADAAEPPAPILNIFVPQTGHTPCVAGLPFFIVICFSSFISRLVRHLRQYASIALAP